MSDKTITGVVTWLRNWFYTKSEVDSLVTTGGTSISIEDTDFFDLFDCVNTNFIDFTTDSEYDGNSLNTSIINIIYPVGSIYMSINSTNPSELFGGTWERIQDRFLLASGTTYTNGATGGEATHTLTINEMPKHTHKIYRSGADTAGDKSFRETSYSTTAARATSETGGGKAHNNMPPYLAVNVWKRTA